MSSHVLFNEETLETMVFERSKMWCNLVEHYSKIDDDEMDIVDFDKDDELWKNEENDDDNADMIMCSDEAVEDKSVDTDIELPNVTSSMAKTQLTQMLCSNGNPEENAEVQQILNQTLPVLEEHKRKWKAAGLDRILNTFDVQKIEQHVGQWLRRNNTIYMEKSPVGCRSTPQPLFSDNESLHSVDTARYIRQSRKRNPSSSTSVKCSTTSTIKMYRTQPHKRDELRAKYAVHNDELEHRHHLQALLHRRRQRELAREREQSHFPSPRHCTNYKTNYHHKRRKHLLKRRPHSSLYYSSSSGEDEYSFRCGDCKTCRTAYPCCSSYRSHHDYVRPQLDTRSMYHLRRNHAFEEDTDMDLRPRLLESECTCCNSERLCSNVVHLTNSSTEEWIVENNSSPKVAETPRLGSNPMMQLLKVSPCLVKKQQHQLKDCEELAISNKKNDGHTNVIKSVKRKTPIETAGASWITQSKKSGLQLKHQPKLRAGEVLLPISEELVISPKSIPNPIKSTTHLKHPIDAQNEVVLALLPRKSNRAQTRGTPTTTVSKSKPNNLKHPIDAQNEVVLALLPRKSNRAQSRGTPTTTVSKSKPNSKKPNSTEDTSETFPVKKSRISKKSTKSQVKKSQEFVTIIDDSNESFSEVQALSNQSYEVDQGNRVQTELCNDELQFKTKTPFKNQSVVCNSTALENDSACARSLHNKHLMQQAPAIVSSTCNSNSTSVSPVEEPNEKTNIDTDCTIVTSTTGEAAKLKPSPIRITKRGILLHCANPESAHFNLTESSLSKIIGQRRARNFLKFHVGSRSFDGRHSVYYRPTPKLAAAIRAGDSLSNNLNISSSSSSDEDIFERIQRYGEVYSVLGKSQEKN